ncbi:hypothetical protein ACJRO7_012171 [Eucalyptus globulus]|uniref:Uncharacterized protein n=1 Tax=Eucalyptus globulus TaxID=34317 RepID=A0ABD3LHQ4_EUCGL
MGGSQSKEERLKKVENKIGSTKEMINKARQELNKDLNDGSGRQIDERDHKRFRKYYALTAKLKDLQSEMNRINKEEEQIPGVGYEKGSSSIVGDIKHLWSKSRKSDS